jgi:Activator of Hsp90 ATPase homolog 1-like protein
VTVSVAACDGGTEVTVEHVQIHDEHMKAEHAAGWAACLERLAAYV